MQDSGPALQAAVSEDELLWGRKPSKVAAVGMNEDYREHLARVRKYLSYYLQLLVRAGDAETLFAAVQFLRKCNEGSSAGYQGIGDLLPYAPLTPLRKADSDPWLDHKPKNSLAHAASDTGTQKRRFLSSVRGLHIILS